MSTAKQPAPTRFEGRPYWQDGRSAVLYDDAIGRTSAGQVVGHVIGMGRHATLEDVERWARYIVAGPAMEARLRELAALVEKHDGDTDEEEWNDMEDAYNNGLDVGTYETMQDVAAIAQEALAILDAGRRFRCASATCPGYPYRASEQAHPASCLGTATS